MPPSIQDVLALDPVRHGRPEVVAGADLLGRTVRWAHVSQLTDLTGLLRGGELVLTTADALRGGAVRPYAYLAGLAEAGAAGVVVELPAADGDFADAMREAAAGMAFPVVLLARSVRFVEVTEAVHSRIVNEQYEEVRFAQRAHEVFTALSLEHAPPEVIVARAAALTDTAVVFEDVAHRVLAAAPGPGETGTEVLDDWERRSRLAPDDWLYTPVDVHGQPWGRLVMPSAGAATPAGAPSAAAGGPAPAGGPRLGMVLERAAQALTLRLMAEQNQADVRRRAQSGLISELTEGRIGTEAEALVRARAVGLRAGALYVPVAVRYAGAPSGPVAPSAEEALRRDRQFVAAVARTVAAVGVSSLTSTVRLGEVALVLSCPRPYDEDALLERFADVLGGQLPAGVPGRPEGEPRLRVGVGPSQPSLIAAARRLTDAAHTAEVAAAMTGPERPFYRGEHLRLRGLLSVLRDNRHLRAFAESELHRLLDHEARKGSGHLDLLRQYLAVNGNKNELARRTSLSRPALYARLAAIERLLDVRLDDPETRVCLYLALLARDLDPRTPD